MSPRLHLWLLFGWSGRGHGGGAGGRAPAHGSRRLAAGAGAAPDRHRTGARLAPLDKRWGAAGIALAREIELLLHARIERTVAPLGGHALGRLPDAVSALVRRISEEQQDAAIARAAEQQSIATFGAALAASERATALRREQRAQFGPEPDRMPGAPAGG